MADKNHERGSARGRGVSAAGLENDEEGRPRVRMGRLDERDARVFDSMGRMGGLAALWRLAAGGRPSAPAQPQTPRVRWDRALIDASNRRRVHYALGSWSPGAGPEAVVKAAGRFHDAAGAAKALSYIAGPGKAGLREPGDIYDQRGGFVDASEARDHIRQWRERPGARPETPPPGAKRRRVIAWHFVWSVPAPPGDEDAARRLEAAAAKTFEEVFAAHQFSFYWRLHTDTPGRPHVHLLVKARAAGGARIRCDRDGNFLYALRARFADNLTVCGLPATATRREDRLHLLHGVAQGRARLRANKTGAHIHIQLHDTRPSRRAPRWWARHGEAALRRIKAERATESAGGRVFGFRFPRIKDAGRCRDMPEAHNLIYDALSGAYRNGGKAYESLMQLAAETPIGWAAVNPARRFPNANLAAWLLEHAPEWFGEPKLDADTKTHLRNAAARMRALPGGDDRFMRAAEAHGAPHSAPHDAPLGSGEAAHNLRAAARSLRKLLAWYRTKPHWPEQAAVLQNRIALLERAGTAEGVPLRGRKPEHIPALRPGPASKSAPKPASPASARPAATAATALASTPPLAAAAASTLPSPAADKTIPPPGRTAGRGQSRRRPPDLSR